MEIGGSCTGPPTQCLICRNVVKWEGTGEDLLEQQLRVIYVVSKLLEIPEHFTTRLLAEYGNPGEWTTFCAQCHTLVVEGEELFRDIQQLEKKHKKVRDSVRLAMQVKPEPDDLDSSMEGGGATTFIREFLETLDAFTDQQEEELITVSASPYPHSDSGQNRETSPVRDTPPPPTKRKSKRLRISNTKNPIKQEQLPIIKNDRDSDDHTDMSTRGDEDDATSSDSDDDVRQEAPKKKNFHIRRRPPPTKKRRAAGSQYLKKPKKPRPTFQEVLQVNNDFAQKLLPLSKTASTEERLQRRRDTQNHTVSALAKAKKIKEFPCQTCPQVFSKYRDWLTHTHFKGCDQNPEHKVMAFGVRIGSRYAPNVRKRLNKAPLLTFQEVLQVHKDFTQKLLPLSKTASKEEKAKRRVEMLKNSVKRLVDRNYITEFPCQTCPQVFSKYQDWVRHTHFEGCDLNPEHKVKKFKTPVVINKIKCEDCGKLLGSRWTLEDHYRSHHSPKDIQLCRGCNGNFIQGHVYQKHYRESNPESSDCFKFGVKCEDCRVVRNSPEALELHRTLHHINPTPDPAECLQCEKTFMDMGCLRAHVRKVHTPRDQRQFKCDRPGCSTLWLTAARLSEHVRHVHLPKEGLAPTYPCSECGREFSAAVRLNRHKQIHNTDNPSYLCTICGKTFKMKEYLTQHSLSHVADGNRNRFAKLRENKEKRKRKLEEAEKAE